MTNFGEEFVRVATRGPHYSKINSGTLMKADIDRIRLAGDQESVKKSIKQIKNTVGYMEPNIISYYSGEPHYILAPNLLQKTISYGKGLALSYKSYVREQ